ncbi:MAG: outer membrane protein assembly factor BamC [Cycloclasticus sp.]|nr:outer membrane protein assembly factor BamC [Cycloclasticus sp.]MBQ0789492.1 outer membrane protein assembly factor BamC [Cycloclasticus sp.]
MIKLCVVLLSLGLVACGSLPSVDEVFSDQKEAYKKAHELPPLEVPPELSKGQTKDEYDGGAQTPVAKRQANVTTQPLVDKQPFVEQVKQGVDSHLLVQDSLRNVWRKTVTALEELDYDVGDKNRENSLIYLNIATAKQGGMLSTLSFWKKAETQVYLVALERVETGVAVRVLDEQQTRIDDEFSRGILADLLTKLTP